MDAARSAIRLGVREVNVACLESAKDMPAHSWDIENTIREGAKIFPSLAPQQFLKGESQRVRQVDFKPVASCRISSDGNLTWTLQECAGSSVSMETDTVIVAIGQSPTLLSLSLNGKLKTTRRNTLDVDPETLSCGRPGLFAAGDAVVGAGTVVEAMAAGRKAAAQIIRYLGARKHLKGSPH